MKSLTQIRREYATRVLRYGEHEMGVQRLAYDLMIAEKKAAERNAYNREKNEALRILCGTSAAAAKRDMGL